MEQNQTPVDEREYQEWLVQNNLENPLPKTETTAVPDYQPQTVNPDELNQSGRDAGTALMSIAPDIAKAVGLAGTAIGAYKFGQQAINKITAPKPYTPPAGGSFNAPASANTPMPTRPVAPTIEPGGQKLVDFNNQQGQFKKPGIVQQGIDYTNRIRQAAMDRVITPAAQAAPRIASAAAPVARAATGIGALVMPGNVGQNYPFPTSGPMKGREINPTTGAPWSPQELQAYRSVYGT